MFVDHWFFLSLFFWLLYWLSVLWFTTAGYAFGTFKLFLLTPRVPTTPSKFSFEANIKKKKKYNLDVFYIKIEIIKKDLCHCKIISQYQHSYKYSLWRHGSRWRETVRVVCNRWQINGGREVLTSLTCRRRLIMTKVKSTDDEDEQIQLI